MSFSNLGYNGNTPSNVSVQDNINQALQYQATHSTMETLEWFKSMVQNKGAWDYKQLSSDYENFGNFNYGAVGAALGYPDFVLQSAAGGAQFTSLYGIDIKFWAALDWIASWHPFVDSGSYDDPKDQAWINKGIEAAQVYGFDPYMQALQSIDNAISGLFNSAQGWMFHPFDPLVLDLDDDGIETLQINTNSPVLFDHDGDGIKIATGWVKSDDGLLVLDRNGNGTIDNGSELFGDQTIVNGVKATDGFAALSAQDTNNNGTFDINDTNFNNVRVWQDLNQNGISETNELKTLTQAGIVSISLSSTQTNIAVNGGIQTAEGTFTKSDGTIGESATVDVSSLGNYIFNTNSFYREFSDTIALTEVASTLPQMQGSGLVRDLREAASMQTRLTPQLQNYTKPLNNINLSQYITKLEMRTDIIKNNFFICLKYAC